MRRIQKISLYLFKEGISPEDSLKEDLSFNVYGKIPNSKYIIKQSLPYSPPWAIFLDLEVKAQRADAVLFVPCTESQWIAICFGNGHNLLDKNKIVNDFGLITALNMLDKNKIKSSDISNPSDHSKKKRVQTPRDSNLKGHDIDYYGDILKKITGKTKEEYKDLSKSINASVDNIAINTNKPAEELKELCASIFEIFRKEDYKNNFPEVFYINPIRDSEKVKQLNEVLLEHLNARDQEIYLDIPEIIDFQDIHEFNISFKDRAKHRISTLDIKEFYNLLEGNREITLEDIKRWILVLLDENRNREKEFNIFRCLVFDYENENETYHFSDGRWYSLNSSYLTKLNSIQEFKVDKINNRGILPYHHNNEEEYNQQLAKSLEAILLDRQLIPMGGYDKIEPCDVFCLSENKKNIFVHVKRKHKSSSGLSHLFAQGDNSLTLLNNRNEQFIDGLKQTLKDEFHENYKSVVHFLIIGNSIPLFSKMSLLKTIDQIRSKGAEVFWSIIDEENTTG